MKLYMHPVSTACRPVLLFIADNEIDIEQKLVDLQAGEQYGEEFRAINPNSYVPVLEEGDFRLTESSAILKYLADVIESPAYPRDLRERAHVNELMDWFNVNFYRDYGYNLIYPQLFDHHRRPEAAQAVTLDWGRKGCERYLQVLDSHWLGDGRPYLCGAAITIADYFGAGILSLGELVACSFDRYPNVQRWFGRMKEGRNWAQVNAVLYGFSSQLKDKEFVHI